MKADSISRHVSATSTTLESDQIWMNQSWGQTSDYLLKWQTTILPGRSGLSNNCPHKLWQVLWKRLIHGSHDGWGEAQVGEAAAAAVLFVCFFSGKIPALHLVPCGCGLGKRHSNAFVTQQGGNCKRFLDNCAFVPLPGGYWASQEPNNTPESDLEQAPESGSTAQPTVLNGQVICIKITVQLLCCCSWIEAELK